MCTFYMQLLKIVGAFVLGGFQISTIRLLTVGTSAGSLKLAGHKQSEFQNDPAVVGSQQNSVQPPTGSITAGTRLSCTNNISVWSGLVAILARDLVKLKLGCSALPGVPSFR